MFTFIGGRSPLSIRRGQEGLNVEARRVVLPPVPAMTKSAHSFPDPLMDGSVSSKATHGNHHYHLEKTWPHDSYVPRQGREGEMSETLHKTLALQ